MAKRNVFGRIAAKVGDGLYKFELKADGLHVRQHRSRTVQVLSFKAILAGCQSYITMRTHKRYQTEQEIIQEMDDTVAKAQAHLHEANRLELKLKDLRQRNDPGEVWIIEETQKSIGKSRTSATNLLEGRLKRLSAKLAEFRTMQLPGVDNGDRSIPA